MYRVYGKNCMDTTYRDNKPETKEVYLGGSDEANRVLFTLTDESVKDLWKLIPDEQIVGEWGRE